MKAVRVNAFGGIEQLHVEDTRSDEIRPIMRPCKTNHAVMSETLAGKPQSAAIPLNIYSPDVWVHRRRPRGSRYPPPSGVHCRRKPP